MVTSQVETHLCRPDDRGQFAAGDVEHQSLICGLDAFESDLVLGGCKQSIILASVVTGNQERASVAALPSVYG